MLLLTCTQVFGQVWLQQCPPVPVIIDLSTGIDNNGQKINMFQYDDDWKVNAPYALPGV